MKAVFLFFVSCLLICGQITPPIVPGTGPPTYSQAGGTGSPNGQPCISGYKVVVDGTSSQNPIYTCGGGGTPNVYGIAPSGAASSCSGGISSGCTGATTAAGVAANINAVTTTQTATQALSGPLNAPVFSNILSADGFAQYAGVGQSQVVYSASVTYPNCQAVSYSGNNYIAVGSSTGVTPGSNQTVWYQVPDATTPTFAACAYYTAASLSVGGSQSWLLQLGSGYYNSNYTLVGPTVNSHATVSLRGAGSTRTYLKYTGTSSNPFLLQSISPDNSPITEMEVSNMTVMANSTGPCGSFTGVRNLFLQHLYCRSAIGSFAWSVGVSGGSIYQAWVDDLQWIPAAQGGSGATVSVNTSTGSPVFTVSAGGSGYPNGTNTVTTLLLGTGATSNLAFPCSVMGTISTVVSGGALSSVTGSGFSGCITSGAYVSFYPTPFVTNGEVFYTFDSTIKDLISGPSVNASLQFNSPTNRIIHPHPEYSPLGIQDYGGNHYWGIQTDSLYRYGIDLEGSSTVINDLAPVYNPATPGSGEFYFGTSAAQISIMSHTCGGYQNAGGYNEFVSSSAGPITPGGSGWPSQTDMLGTNILCDGTNGSGNDNISEILGGVINLNGLSAEIAHFGNAGSSTTQYIDVNNDRAYLGTVSGASFVQASSGRALAFLEGATVGSGAVGGFDSGGNFFVGTSFTSTSDPFQINLANGHIISHNTAPTTTSTGCTIGAKSTDNDGFITLGSGATSCVITFHSAFGSGICQLTPSVNTILPTYTAPVTSSMAVGVTYTSGSPTVSWSCRDTN